MPRNGRAELGVLIVEGRENPMVTNYPQQLATAAPAGTKADGLSPNHGRPICCVPGF
jgi:hypothetical protein